MPEANAVPDRDWIQSIVDRYEGPLLAYAARHTSDLHRARDVVQDTFLKLWQADRARVEGHLAKWLYTVCRNGALDVHRKERRMMRLTTEVDSPAEAPASIADGAPVNDIPNTAGLIDLLTVRQAEVVRLKFQGGLSYKEIAEVMDTTVTNVGVLLHNAIKSIRRKLEDNAPQSNPSATSQIS